MENAPWVVQVYEMTDLAAQRAIAEVLSGNSAMVVDTRTGERGIVLTVELSEPAEALAVYEMVMMADPNAELIHTTAAPRDVSDDAASV